jgi:hypothetical protein
MKHEIGKPGLRTLVTFVLLLAFVGLEALAQSNLSGTPADSFLQTTKATAKTGWNMLTMLGTVVVGGGALVSGYIGRKYAFDDASGFAKRRLTVIVDEVADALAPESVNILNKARGAGLSLVMAGQSLADLEVALGSAPDARRALANVGSFLTLRAANPDDARFFTEKVGVRPFPVVTRGESYEPDLFATDPKGHPDFAYRTSISTSLRNEHLLPTSALDRLARFHFFGLWGGELRKGMLPLLHAPGHLYSPILKGRPSGERGTLERGSPNAPDLDSRPREQKRDRLGADLKAPESP